ncbi:amidase [Actinomadura madurae]|uniref:amidase n=1 Tax=Actinomadura madurae TaxID=1993 RepID=UPI0020D1F74D|nr:amidase [Actinomadura madurae]MCQ0004720.1 amidase [Actinomadura madurae]
MELGLAGQAEALARGEISSSELVEESLESIGRQESLGAFRAVRSEAAGQEALDADKRLAEGSGCRCSGCPSPSRTTRIWPVRPRRSRCWATTGPRCRTGRSSASCGRPGAVIVGKTTTCEIGLWPFSESPGYGVARNPWNPEYTPGGSSGGSAAAVAAGMVAGAVGSDGAGSIRIPAAWTGLVGIKPQRGRVSGYPRTDPFNGITVWGPIARSVGDAALLLDVLSGSHPDDVYQVDPPLTSFAEAARREPRRLRIAVSFRTAFGVSGRLDPEIRAAVERLARRLTDLGHKVFPADPDYGLVALGLVPRGTSGVADWLDAMPNPRPEHRTEVEARMGRLVGKRLLPLAKSMDPYLRRKIGRIFQAADVVMTPTTAQPPLKVGAFDGMGYQKTQSGVAAACPYAWTWNVVGWPGVNVPGGIHQGRPAHRRPAPRA